MCVCVCELCAYVRERCRAGERSMRGACDWVVVRVRVATRARAWLRIRDSDLTAAPRPVPRPRPPPPPARLRPPRRHPAVREWPPCWRGRLFDGL